MSSRNDREKSSQNWWPKKKRKEKRMDPKVKEAWIKEYLGDQRMARKKPSAWRSPPRVGMDKIRAKTSLSKYFIDFASSSTIHGLNHTVCPHRHPFERFLACVFIIGALVCLILLSMNFWGRYQNEPFIVALDNDYRSFEVTRPAFMMCPMERLNVAKFESVFKRHNVEDTAEAREFFDFLAEAEYQDYAKTPLYTGVSSDKWLTILYELRPDMVSENSDGSIGDWIITGKGFCQAYYSYFSIYSSYDYWMQNNWTIVLPTNIIKYVYWDRDNVTAFTMRNVDVTINSYFPAEIPEMDKPCVPVRPLQIAPIAVLPREVVTSHQVKKLSKHQRKCKMPEDGGLEMWPIYTQEMCTQECIFEAMLRICECYPYYARPMPDIPICTAAQMHCIGEHQHEFKKVHKHAATLCDCAQNCDYSIYTDEPSPSTNLKAGSPLLTVMNVHIHFPPFILRRQLQYGITDFMTSVGGGAGLFLGASVISFIEIFYYATLRLYWYRDGLREEKKTKLKSRRVVPTTRGN